MSFCTIILSQSIKIMQNYVTWIQISLSSTKDVSKYIAYDAKRTFDTSILWNWEAANWVEREIWLMKDELSEKIMIELVGLKLKTYSYIKMAILMTKKLREQRNV